MEYHSIILTKEEDVAIITMNHPETMNALEDELAVELLDAYINVAQSVAEINAGKLNVRDLATHVFSLDQLDEAFQVAMDAQRSIKVLIKVDPEAPDCPYNKQ